MEKNFERLPKWAQLEIQVMKKRIAYLENQLAQVMGYKETNTFISEGLSSKPLPNNSVIEFAVDSNSKATVYVNGNVININTDSRNGKRMVILPIASNCFEIKFVNY